MMLLMILYAASLFTSLPLLSPISSLPPLRYFHMPRHAAFSPADTPHYFSLITLPSPYALFIAADMMLITPLSV